MDKKSGMMLRVLINRYHPKEGAALLKFLPKEEQAAMSTIDIKSNDLRPMLQYPQNAIHGIHYSWIKPLIDAFPTRLQPIIMVTLTTQQLAGFKASVEMRLSNFAKTFILNILCKQLKIHEHLPTDYLPENELSPLALWTKQQLMDLIDFLGLYDLASEVRHIVNRNHLKNIYACLTPKQFHYLKVCLHHKEQVTSPRLDIDPSKQDCPKLKQAIHRRGLSRLAKSLCGQHADFVWTIAHILDTGRGSILLREYQPEALPKITPVLKQQVLNIMNFFKSE